MLFGDAARRRRVGMAHRLILRNTKQEGAALHARRGRFPRMAGRFLFAATRAVEHYARCYRSGFTLEQVDRIILHQGSRYIVETIGTRLPGGPQPEFYAADYGNTVSSAIPIAFADGVASQDHIVVLSGFGVGLCWATTVLERVRNDH